MSNSLASRNTFWMLLLSWAIALVGVADGLWTREGASPGRIEGTVDPNTAPWWELTILPEIGPSLARRIVTHRESILAAGASPPLFRSEKDLDAVKGIGPKTIARLGPHLRFKENAGSAGSARSPQ